MKTQNAKRLLKSLWMRACRFDKIPLGSKFVVFSEENKYADKYNRIACLITTGNSINYKDRSIVSRNIIPQS